MSASMRVAARSERGGGPRCRDGQECFLTELQVTSGQALPSADPANRRRPCVKADSQRTRRLNARAALTHTRRRKARQL
jgi:hypothetical protein